MHPTVLPEGQSENIWDIADQSIFFFQKKLRLENCKSANCKS